MWSADKKLVNNIMANTYSKLEKKIGYKFKSGEILQNVFVHRSFLNENVGKEIDSNERLEFLGDAVLELVVTDYLYNNYKNPEGELTNWRAALVRGQMLAKLAKEIDLGENLMLSKGEEKSGGKTRDIILANAFEALIGAIYIDGKYAASEKFITKFVLSKLDVVLETKSYIDAKSRFQELVQEKMGITPKYQVISEFGPDHSKSFAIGAYIGDKLVGEGTGSSKQIAQQEAAADALENWSEFSV